ncbi:MAG: hypothetical protein IKC61_03910, partial [Clostridia bacterium]|nr:hypothetical protein [Clostridia bacterium]
KYQEAVEREKEIFAHGYRDLDERKARKEAEKAAEREARIAAASFVPPMAVYDDFTETFDQAAYDADKKAEADAVAQANAEVRAAKANEKAEANAKKAAKTEANYDKKTAEHIEKMERKESLLSDAKADKKEQQARKDAAYQTQRATRIAAASAVVPVATYADFTETFDREAYEKDKKDIAEIEAKAKAEAKSAIITRKTASEAKEEARIVNFFDKTTGEQIAKMEQKADFTSFIDQANEDQKRLNAIARAKAEGARLAVSDDGKIQETVYADPEFIAAELDMHELYEESSAKLEDVIDGKTDSLFSAEDLRRSAQNRKDQEAIELLNENLSQDEMLQFADDYDKDLKRNKKLLEKAEKYGKFMLEYGATYDPEWDGEFNNYGLPEVHPFTEGVKLSESRRRAPRRERLSGFNKKDLSKLSRAQCDTDNKMINARLEAQYADLELEVVRVQQEFSGEYRNTKEKRWLRDNKRKLKGMKARIAAALKYEKLDNERYYSVVATDFDRVELPASADRTDLIAMRDEVMRLLDIRDDINVQLIELYTGSDEGAKGDLENIKRRTKVVLKARKRAHAKYNKFYKMLSKHRVTRNEKMRIFDKMDEFVELKGEVAKIKYILRKEKPIGRAKRRYIRERKAAKRDIRTAKRWILRLTDKAIKRAKKRERRARAMFMAYTFLALIGVFAFVVILIGPQILETLKTVTPESLHKYIDSILTNWPF